MLSSSNLLKASSSSISKLWPLMGPHHSNAMINGFQRKYSDIKSASRSNQEYFGHNSEEAAENRRIFRKMEPDSSRGTPVKDFIRKDKEGKNFTPKIVRDDLKVESAEVSENIQNLVNRSAGDKDIQSTLSNLIALGKLENVSNGVDVSEPVDLKFHDPLVDGHKFGLPELPIPKDGNFKYRDDPIVQQVTNLLMRDGKKGVAQRNMSYILNALRTAPPPKFNSLRPLIPGHPPPHHLPLDPIGYLTLAIDSVAPIIRIRSERGAAGGGAALQIPVPLRSRQRRRQAIIWILDSVNKRVSRGSGRGTFAQRFADEIISIVEGRSSAWDKRLMVHKTGTTARNNINFRRRR